MARNPAAKRKPASAPRSGGGPDPLALKPLATTPLAPTPLAPTPLAPEPQAPDPLAIVAAHLARGETDRAVQTLLAALDRRAAHGDRDCAVAAAGLRLAAPPLPVAPDALSATVQRLVTLVQRQEDQIRALRDLIEAEL